MLTNIINEHCEEVSHWHTDTVFMQTRPLALTALLSLPLYSADEMWPRAGLGNDTHMRASGETRGCLM